MSNLNKLILPVKNESSGEITNQEFNLSSSGGSTLSKLILPVKNESSGEITNQEFNLPSGGGGSGTPITPSNSSPASMEQGETYTPTANGKAVESVTDIIPSNSNPPALSAGNIYKPGESGYAIGSYTNVTPTTSGTYFSSGIKKMSSSGYAYSSQPSGTKGARGSFTASQLANTITCGFEPKTIAVIQHDSNMSKFCTYAYSKNASSSYSTGGRYKDSSTHAYNKFSVPTSTTGISAISSTGFSINVNALTNYGNIIDWFATE